MCGTQNKNHTNNLFNYIKVLFNLGYMININHYNAKLIMTLLLVGKKKEEMLAHYFGSTKLHFHLFIQQS
jgi:hypothetical protein